jgi:hypothetical protein
VIEEKCMARPGLELETSAILARHSYRLSYRTFTTTYTKLDIT